MPARGRAPIHYNPTPVDPLALLSIFTVSLLHTLIPSHWLCFVVVGRAQGWRIRQTLVVAALAGAVHVAATVGLGVGLRAFGAAMMNEHALETTSAIVLLALAAMYLGLHFAHGGHHHEHDRRRGGRVAVFALVLSLMLSPCTAAIPFMIVAVRTWLTVVVVAALLLVATVGTMLLLVGLTSLGIERLRFAFVERYEKIAVGAVLAALGAGLLLLHGAHADELREPPPAVHSR